SNLVGMGVVPLQFEAGTTRQTLALTGRETVTIEGLEGITPRQTVTAEITYEDGSTKSVPLLCRIDTADEIDYMKAGGILHYVLRNLMAD
ncbi:MAG: aconitate hydratase, partial [Hyphomicrobiales bacterium]|nr:aconitate hydratase [Hyphomicrobiales bacterium]